MILIPFQTFSAKDNNPLNKCLFVLTDVDECTTGSPSCHVNATCTDIVGSYTCACKNDSIGDGVQCKYIGTERSHRSKR